MNLKQLTGALLISTALALPAAAQVVGSPLPNIKLSDFTQTEARNVTDLVGRAVILEFFAHW